MFAAAFVLLTALPGFAQTRRTLDLETAPWRGVMATHQSRGPLAAVPELESIARQGDGLVAWQRAHAWRWAGEIAQRSGQLGRARSDYAQAIALDADGYEGRMAREHVAEIAIAEHHWAEARSNLLHLHDDPDPVIRFYARDRLQTVDEHVRRTALRWGSIASVAVALALLAWLAVRAPRTPGAARAFGRALLVTETLAIAAVALVPRWNPLGQSGTMAGALPAALLGAGAWALIARNASTRLRVGVAALWLVALAAAVYLGLDLLWWSVERPIP